MLAGWLFADLFLVLLVAGLAALPAKSADKPPPPPPPPSATTSPPASHPIGLDPRHLDFSIAITPTAYRAGGQDELLREVNAQLDQMDPTHRPVGFVIVFASDDQGHIQRANDTAAQVFDLLHAHSPVFASSTGFGYWNGNHNNFEFKVFLLN